MLNHSSAKQYEETRHANKGTKNKTLSRNGTSGARQEAGAGSRSRKTTISDALRRRAQSIIKDRSINAEGRALIRYGLETNDPWLPELVRRAEAGETIINRRGLLANARDLRRRFKRIKD